MPNGMSKYRGGAQASRDAIQNRETWTPTSDPSSVQGALPATPTIGAAPSMPQGYVSQYNGDLGAYAPDWSKTLQNKGQAGPQTFLDDPAMRAIESRRQNLGQTMGVANNILGNQLASNDQQYNQTLTKIQQAADAHAKGDQARRQMFLAAIQNLLGGGQQAPAPAVGQMTMAQNTPPVPTASAFGRYR